MVLPQNEDNLFTEREQLLKKIFSSKNLLRILLQYLGKDLLKICITLCGSFVNKEMLKIYKEEMNDRNLTDPELTINQIFSLENILLLSATDFRFNNAFQENIKRDNPNLTILRKCHNQVRTKALASEHGNNLANPLMELPQRYADSVNKAIKIRSDGHNKVKELRTALKDSFLYFLARLILASLFASLFIVPFASIANGVLRSIALVIFLGIRGFFVPYTDMSAVLNITISFVFALISLTDTSCFGCYVLFMIYIIYAAIPILCIIWCPCSCPCQSFKDFIVEKRKMNRKDKKLKKVLFIQ